MRGKNNLNKLALELRKLESVLDHLLCFLLISSCGTYLNAKVHKDENDLKMLASLKFRNIEN